MTTLGDVERYFTSRGAAFLYEQIWRTHQGPSWFLTGLAMPGMTLSEMFAIATGHEAEYRQQRHSAHMGAVES